MKRFERYFETVNFLESLSNIPLKNDYMDGRQGPRIFIDRMRYFLKLIGNPDRGFKFIHITGTAGKGTVATATHEILTAAGHQTGLFTSPFVTTSIEKIRVGKKFIAPDEFARIIEDLKPVIDRLHKTGPYGRPSHFEIFLAAAFIYFKKKRCEWVILEAGCGGRFDATNVIVKSVVSAVTNVDYDHTEILGETLKKIAADKAGIIKPRSIFFTSEQRPALLSLFKKICRQKRVVFNRVPKKSSPSERNELLARKIAESLGIGEKHIALGLSKARLPARFETVSKKPLVIIDGAHNRIKMRATAAAAKNMGIKKLNLIIAIADNKNHGAILKEIIPLAGHVFFTRFENRERKCAPPIMLAEKSKPFLKKTARKDVMLDPRQAFKKAMTVGHKDTAVLITGSFFLAGALRKKWFSEEQILKNREISYFETAKFRKTDSAKKIDS